MKANQLLQPLESLKNLIKRINQALEPKRRVVGSNAPPTSQRALL